MRREKELVKNTLILSISMFVPKISSMITLPIITAYVSKTELGTFDLIGTIACLLLPLITLQIQTAAFRFLIDVRNNQDKTECIISTIFFFVLFVSSISIVIIFFCLYKLDMLIRILMSLYFLTYITVTTLQQVARGISKNEVYSLSAVVQTFFNVTLIILFVMFMQMGLRGLLISSIVSSLSADFVLLLKGDIVGRISIKKISLNKLKEMLSYSWPMVPNSLSLWVMSLSDRLVITSFLGLEANAIYAIANKIPLLFDSVQATFIQAWQENASISSRDFDSNEYYSKMFDSVSCILSGLMCILVAFTPLIFKLFIRGEYIESYYQMPLLFMGMLFSCLSSFLGGIYVAFKRTKNVGITTSVAALINLILDFLLINKIGIFAGSISTLISYFALLIYRMWDVLRFQNIKYDICHLFILLLVPSIMCVLCFINNPILNIFNCLIGCIFSLLFNKQIIMVFVKNLKKRRIR